MAFEDTARAMAADLRESGWTIVGVSACTHVDARDRWRSPDQKRELTLADAWDRARRDAEAARDPRDPEHHIHHPPGFEPWRAR